MEIVGREPRRKRRKIILHKTDILGDIDVLSYKLAETSVQDEIQKDSVASDSEDGLDGSVLGQLLDCRESSLRKRLEFCLAPEFIEVVDNTADLNADLEYDFILPEKFKDANLKIAARLMHDYLVRSTLLDWYNQTGTGFGATLVTEVTNLESKVVDIFRVPGIVYHPSMIYMRSYRNR